MSYARFGWDDSDVYLFEHVNGGLECCGCILSGTSVRFTDLVEFCRHLDEHTAVGHTVPDHVIPAVLAGHAAGEFTDWDTTGDPARLDPWTNRQAPPTVTRAGGVTVPAGAVENVPEAGVCALCGQLLIRTPDDCWHPHDVARACPPEPPGDSLEYILWHQAGNRTLRPGREHWRPV